MEALLPYYERELAFLRQYSRNFAEQYPKIASRLGIAGEQSDDPHVERMIDAFALLTARVGKKLDDDCPEFAEALADVLYPHYLRPFPSCSIAQFAASGAEGLDAPVTIARGTGLSSRKIGGVPCRFRTIFDVTLAPIQIVRAACRPLGALPKHAPVLPGNAAAVVSIAFESTHETHALDSFGLPSVRAHLHGEQSFIAALADSLFLKATSAYVEAGEVGEWRKLSDVPLARAGFTDAEALIDYPARSHPAYRLLTEYFAFPEKFDFIDFDFAAMLRKSGPCRRVTLHVVLAETRADTQAPRLVESLSPHHVRLFCTPVVNLFAQRGEPIHVSQQTVSYPVVADVQRAGAYEVYSIDEVHLVNERADAQTVTEFRPFYALRHDEAAKAGRYWFARRNAWVAENSPGYETEIALVDSGFAPADAQTNTLSMALTCTNRDLPSRLAIGLEGGDLFAPAGMFDEPIAMLCRPTPSVRVESGPLIFWSLTAHLALNHQSLVRGDLAALKELLTLYDLRRTPISARHIEGLVGIEQRPAVHWLPGKPFATFVRGIEIRLTVEEANFVGTSLESFVRMLDVFFGLYVSLNCFVQLTVVSKRTGEEITRCNPRSAKSMLA